MATLASQSVKRSGLTPSYVAASGGGDSFPPNRCTFLHVKNGGGAPVTVTIITPGNAAPDVPIADVAVAVPNAGERMIGPFPADLFANPATGLADITYSGVTSLTIAAVELVQP